MDVSVVVLRNFWAYVIIFFVFWLMSFIFILDVDLSLQTGAYARSNHQTAWSLLVVLLMSNGIESIWSVEWLCSSSREIQRLLDSILSLSGSSELLKVPIEWRTASIIDHWIFRESWCRVRKQLLTALWEAANPRLLVGNQCSLSFLCESLLACVVHSTLTSGEIKESRWLRGLYFRTYIWKCLCRLQRRIAIRINLSLVLGIEVRTIARTIQRFQVYLVLSIDHVWPLLESRWGRRWLTLECLRIERADVALRTATDAGANSVVLVGWAHGLVAAVRGHWVKLTRFVWIHVLLVGVTSIQGLLVLQPVLLEVGELLHVAAVRLAVVAIGRYWETGARTEILSSEIILVTDMLLLKLHSEIIVPIGRATGNAATRGLLLEKLMRTLLKLWRIVRVWGGRQVSHWFTAHGSLRAMQTVISSGGSRLMNESNERFLPLIWSGGWWQLGLSRKLWALIVVVLLQRLA